MIWQCLKIQQDSRQTTNGLAMCDNTTKLQATGGNLRARYKGPKKKVEGQKKGSRVKKRLRVKKRGCPRISLCIL